MNHKLTAFLYLLMRDELTSGKVEQLLEEVEKMQGSPLFSAIHLEAYAKSLAERLT